MSDIAAEAWVAYAIGLTLVLMSPGPVALTFISQSLKYGNAVRSPLVLAGTFGQLTALLLSFVFITVLLKMPPTIYLLFRLLGGVLLVWIALTQLRKKTMPPDVELTAKKSQDAAKTGGLIFFVAATSPLTILFHLNALPLLFASTEKPFTTTILAIFIVATSAAVIAFSYSFIGSSAKKKVSSVKVSEELVTVSNIVILMAGIFSIITLVPIFTIAPSPLYFLLLLWVLCLYLYSIRTPDHARA